MNNKSLNGRDIIAGGNINIPMDIKVLDTTKSINKNGKYIKNPIWKAVFNSLIANAGTNTCKGIFSLVIFAFGVVGCLAFSTPLSLNKTRHCLYFHGGMWWEAREGFRGNNVEIKRSKNIT